MYTVYGLKHVYSVQHIVYIINTVNIIHSVFGVKNTVYMLYTLRIYVHSMYGVHNRGCCLMMVDHVPEY